MEPNDRYDREGPNDQYVALPNDVDERPNVQSVDGVPNDDRDDRDGHSYDDGVGSEQLRS